MVEMKQRKLEDLAAATGNKKVLKALAPSAAESAPAEAAVDAAELGKTGNEGNATGAPPPSSQAVYGGAGRRKKELEQAGFSSTELTANHTDSLRREPARFRPFGGTFGMPGNILARSRTRYPRHPRFRNNNKIGIVR